LGKNAGMEKVHTSGFSDSLVHKKLNSISYEFENENNVFNKNMGCNLSFYYNV
jgi:hypothetical protein